MTRGPMEEKQMDARVMEGVIGDAEARLSAVRGHADAMSAKAAGLDAVVTHMRNALRKIADGAADAQQIAKEALGFPASGAVDG